MQKELVTRAVSDLVSYPCNSRTHSEAQIAQIAASIKEFGFTTPILIDEQGRPIAGRGRLLAAQQLKMPTVPCLVLSGLSDAQKVAYAIADNKLALNAGWDETALQAEFERLAELQYDMNLTGFSDLEIAALLQEIAEDLAEPVVDAGEMRPAMESSDPLKEWKGMPEFSQPEAGPFRTIFVHFKDQASVDAFAELIGQNLTDKTKWVWYPGCIKDATASVYAG